MDVILIYPPISSKEQPERASWNPPMYLYFLIVPCYYIICFGCLMGFNMLFYIIFGTNLLNESPVPVSVFLLVLDFCRKGIPNGVQTE